MKTLKNLGFVIFLVITFQNYSVAQAVEKTQSPVHFLIGGGLELGGDEVAKVYFTNGNTQSVNAGQGISIAIGGELQVPKVEKLLLRGTVGFKYVTTAADNAHIRLTRIPLILTANYMVTDKIRLGAGLASHQNIQFKAAGLGRDVKFKSATGPTFEIAYSGVGLTYTAMSYKDQSNVSYSANAFGITFSAVIPKR